MANPKANPKANQNCPNWSKANPNWFKANPNWSKAKLVQGQHHSGVSWNFYLCSSVTFRMPRMFNFCSSVTILYSDKFQFLFLRNILEFWRNFNFCSSVILRKLRFCVGAVRESMMWLVNRVLGAVDMWEAVGGCGRGGCGRGGGHRAQHRPDRKQTNRR